MSSGITTPPVTPQAIESASTPSSAATLTPSTLASTPRPQPALFVSKADERTLVRLNLGSKSESDLNRNSEYEHQKRLASLRKEAKKLEATNWQYESVEKLLGK